MGWNRVAVGIFIPRGFRIIARIAAQRLPWISQWDSIPYIFLIPWDGVAFEEGAVFVLEGGIFVMLFLIGDVTFDRFKIRGDDGEDAIAGLPSEVAERWIALFDPEAGDSFEFLDPIGLGDGAGVVGENMDVILHTTDDDGRTVELFGNAAEIGMDFGAEGGIAEERVAVFGGKDEVKVNGGEGLWHGVAG